jgi:glutathione S-transferase
MVLFNLTSLQMLGARPLDQLPNCARYVQGITGRDAYQRAMNIAGPQAVRPAAD